VEIEGAAVGDAGGEAVLFARGARCEVRAEARPDQRHSVRVAVAVAERVVDDGPDDVLPVRPQCEPLLDQCAALSGAVDRSADNYYSTGSGATPMLLA
jgi:hypothetical protein